MRRAAARGVHAFVERDIASDRVVFRNRERFGVNECVEFAFVISDDEISFFPSRSACTFELYGDTFFSKLAVSTG